MRIRCDQAGNSESCSNSSLMFTKPTTSLLALAKAALSDMVQSWNKHKGRKRPSGMFALKKAEVNGVLGIMMGF